MRTFATAALSVAVLVSAASVSLAQGRGGRGMFAPPQGPMLLLNKSVQDELKLTDDQKTDLKKIQEKMTEAMADARSKNKDDQEALQKARKEITDDTTKAASKIADTLKDDQKKRFKQIEIQVKGIQAFQDEEVAKTLKLTDKQKDDAKTVVEDLTKDTGEIFKDAGGDRTKMAEARKKIAEATTKATDTIVSKLTDDQKKTWKEITGDKFDYKPEFPGFGGGKRKDKKGDKSF